MERLRGPMFPRLLHSPAGPVVTNPEEIKRDVLEWLQGHKNPIGLKLEPGKYLAITRTRIVAVGDTPEEALAEARRQNIKKPLLQRVPDLTNR